MKNIFLCFVLLAFSVSACYDPYEGDSVGFSDVFFPKQSSDSLLRSIVAGESLMFKVGINLGGMASNEAGFTANIKVEDSLLNSFPDYTLLPSDYYTLTTEGSTNSQVLIPSGDFIGYVTVNFVEDKIAKDNMLNDFKYALPLRIVSTSADSILSDYETVVVPVRVMNTYEGNFYAIGENTQWVDSTNTWDMYEKYGDPEDYTICNVRALSSLMFDTVRIDGVANYGGDDYGMYLVVREDNTVNILPDLTSAIQVVEDGTSTWNAATRKFELNYAYTDSVEHKVNETLVFRNRIRDGIDEWRWAGFEGN